MADDPRQFLDTRAQYEQLRQALDRLHDAGVRSATIISQGKPDCDRATLDKFRDKKTDRINFKSAAALWKYVLIHHPDALGLPAPSADDVAADDAARFFAALSKYYDVHKVRIGPRMEWLAGHYRFYQYSEEFNHHSLDLPCAIVVGEFHVVLKSGLVIVEEMQAYDGQLGKTPMTETSFGVCLPKGHEFFFFLKSGPRETPKFCVFYKVHYDGKPRIAQWMKGYMLKGSYDEAYFHTPIYAIRDDTGETVCNILRPTDIPPNILDELNKEVPVARAKHPRGGRSRYGPVDELILTRARTDGTDKKMSIQRAGVSPPLRFRRPIVRRGTTPSRAVFRGFTRSAMTSLGADLNSLGSTPFRTSLLLNRAKAVLNPLCRIVEPSWATWNAKRRKPSWPVSSKWRAATIRACAKSFSASDDIRLLLRSRYQRQL